MKAFDRKKLLRGAVIAIVSMIVLCALINAIVCLSTVSKMKTIEESLTESGYDCILVLGCGVWGNEPTPLLSDRLDAAVALYKAGAAPKILMSGDHGQKGYDEVSVMRKYAMEQGVPSEDIFMDHAGFSTYETMYRAKDVFGVKKAVVVTQKYHLYRALYDADAFDIEAIGTIAVGHTFASQLIWDIRESAARVKDFIWCLVKPQPAFRGDKIDMQGNGEVTLG